MIWKRARRKSTGRQTEAPHILLVWGTEAPDPGSVAAAQDLAAVWGAAVTVLTVEEPPAELDRLARAAGIKRAEAERRLLDDRREAVARQIEGAAPGLDAQIEVRLGKPFIEIIRFVLDRPTDLVVKDAEALHGFQRFLFASTDQHLLRKCPCPVWLRVPGSAHRVKTVLAAVDVNEALAQEPETLQGLNRRILETALRLAAGGPEDSETVVHILHVWDAPGEGFVRLWSGAADGNKAAEAYVNEVRASHTRALDALVAEARGWIPPEHEGRIALRGRLRHGIARDIIPEEAEAIGADVLVMGTIARTGVPGFIIGNTAEDVLNGVDCSVVTVKPPNYVSPVEA